MILNSSAEQILYVNTFHDLVSTPFKNNVNAICWKRELAGNFSEIINKFEMKENILNVDPEMLPGINLSQQGKIAREFILNDIKLLHDHGALPALNIIRHYERDSSTVFFPIDVYSFHVDRSPVPTDTFLCTYSGESSEILPNAQGIQKILIPEIRARLRELYRGPEEGFEMFLIENFLDLHYQPHPDAHAISCGTGNMWRLAVDHPASQVPPCIHRAPEEKSSGKRLMMIC